jgi:hypothetical protein
MTDIQFTVIPLSAKLDHFKRENSFTPGSLIYFTPRTFDSAERCTHCIFRTNNHRYRFLTMSNRLITPEELAKDPEIILRNKGHSGQRRLRVDL